MYASRSACAIADLGEAGFEIYAIPSFSLFPTRWRRVPFVYFDAGIPKLKDPKALYTSLRHFVQMEFSAKSECTFSCARRFFFFLVNFIFYFFFKVGIREWSKVRRDKSLNTSKFIIARDLLPSEKKLNKKSIS